MQPIINLKLTSFIENNNGQIVLINLFRNHNANDFGITH